MAETVLGIFQNKDSAQAAVDELEAAGFTTKDISIIMKQEGEVHVDHGNAVAENATSGATSGAVIGGIAGLLIGIGAIAIPGIGGILIGGPIAAALGLTGAAATTVSGAVTGGLAGGLVGALTGLGVSEEDAHLYEDRIKQGAILLAVPTSEGREAKSILEKNGADQIRSVGLHAK